MRRRMEENAPANNIKRGPGGIVDIEFLVQLWQLKHGRENPELRSPNMLAALTALHKAGHVNSADYEFFTESYLFLRSIEARLRLMNCVSRVLPSEATELSKLADALGYTDGNELETDCRSYLRRNRERFEAILKDEG
jgi:glutamate-ammonia-ligase adenylyltransferase